MAKIYLESRDKRFNRQDWVLTLRKRGIALFLACASG
jgi:hypothetical protein